jgi:hypothetical protein
LRWPSTSLHSLWNPGRILKMTDGTGKAVDEFYKKLFMMTDSHVAGCNAT